MGLAWETVFSRRLGVTPREVEERLVSLLQQMGFALDDPGLALTSIASAIGMDKKRLASDVDLPMVTAPGACSLKRVPLALLREELSEIRAELQRRSGDGVLDSAEARDLQEKIDRGDLEQATAILERRIETNPRDLRAMVLLSDAYRRSGKQAAAWEMIKEALQQYPADSRAQRLAREIEEELHRSPPPKTDAPPEPLEDVILLPEGAFEIRPADVSAAAAGEPVPAAGDESPPSVRTVTMADVYWEQGERETARRIVDEILANDPGDRRALEWKRTHEEKTSEKTLVGFLRAIAKEFGYDLSGPH